ncbi:MAG: AmmeMemoRadiSam system radical SAM enzyme, partial [Candidatus Omnitrophica bacterium]|nr:AmmeMemoRadiSam system radical SAM enzyme [Candidatus Omnitrophota bacterium]
MREAVLYKKLENKEVVCDLCAHRCRIKDGAFGFCGVRLNQAGILYSLSYGKVIASHVDPIEKKPLYHFFPGSMSFSIATPGCNFVCGFCQNWEISQLKSKRGLFDDIPFTSPEDVVSSAVKNKCRSISFTYTEPTIYFEFALDTAKIAKAQGLYTVFVTNGYMSEESVRMISPYLDAANVDLKFFKDESYKKICGGSLQPVLRSIALMKQLGIWVEVTTLVVPGQNDSSEELTGIAEFIAGIDNTIPWHISRFYPQYKMNNLEPTPEETLKEAREIGYSRGLGYVYVGNVHGWGSD